MAGGSATVEIWSKCVNGRWFHGATTTLGAESYDLCEAGWVKRIPGNDIPCFAATPGPVTYEATAPPDAEKPVEEGVKFRDLCESTGLDHDDLAEKVGVKSGTLRAYRTNGKPPADLLEKVRALTMVPA